MKREKLGWTRVTVLDTKGRPVFSSSSGDPRKAHQSADTRMKRGYTQKVERI